MASWDGDGKGCSSPGSHIPCIRDDDIHWIERRTQGVHHRSRMDRLFWRSGSQELHLFFPGLHAFSCLPCPGRAFTRKAAVQSFLHKSLKRQLRIPLYADLLTIGGTQHVCIDIDMENARRRRRHLRRVTDEPSKPTSNDQGKIAFLYNVVGNLARVAADNAKCQLVVFADGPLPTHRGSYREAECLRQFLYFIPCL